MAALDTQIAAELNAELGATELALTAHEWDRPWKALFLKTYALTGNVSSAARACEISRAHVYLVRAHDPVFAAAMVEAREVGIDLLEARAKRRIEQERQVRIIRTRTLTDKNGVVLERETIEETRITEGASDHLIATFLRAQRPEVYGDRQDIRVGGMDGGPVLVEITRAPDRDRLRDLVEVARELGAGDIIDGEAIDEDDEAA